MHEQSQQESHAATQGYGSQCSNIRASVVYMATIGAQGHAL